MEWFMDNLEWIFIGVGATVVSGVVAFLVNRSRKDAHENQSTQTQQQIVNVYTASNDAHKNVCTIKNQADLKKMVHILFIDDERFKMVQILRTMGWSNIEYKKNVVNPDDDVVLRSHVIFVDINGVGGNAYRNQGLGLAAAIKDKHPEKKVIIYSVEPTGDRFDDDLRKIDKCLPKNAEPIQFSNLIEEMCR